MEYIHVYTRIYITIMSLLIVAIIRNFNFVTEKKLILYWGRNHRSDPNVFGTIRNVLETF